MADKSVEQIMEDIIANILAEIRSNAIQVAGDVVREVAIPLTVKAGKVATKKLINGWDCVVNAISEGVQFVLINTATDETYVNEYYWNVVEGGRKKMPSFSGIRERDPFRKSLKNWADSVGFTGNRFWLARNINERGLKGNPALFENIRNDFDTFILKNI